MRISQIAKNFGYQKYMIERYFQMFREEEAIEFIKSNEKKIYPSFRIINTNIEKNKLIKRLLDKKFKVQKSSTIDGAYQVLSQPFSIGATTEYLLGYYFMQRLTSMLPPIILNPNKKELVLDMCAAPGGKTVHLSNLMDNKGILIAIEEKLDRVRSLISNLRRCRVKNTIVLKKDARKLKNLDLKFDKILLDAPCTGEGLIMHDPSRKTSRSENDYKIMSIIQRELLYEGIKYLKKGGILVYSTCSIAPEENEFVINDILERFPVKIMEIQISMGSPGFVKVFDKTLHPTIKNSIRLFPHKDQMEGFYICKLKKMEENQ